MSAGVSGAGAFADHWGRSADSALRLHARVYGAAGGRDVVCLPGLTRNASEFGRIAPLLIEAGAADRVVAIDYRGRGLSDHDPDPSRYVIPVETADVLTTLAEIGVTRAFVLGVSRGGLIAMGLGAVRPDLVAGIVLVDIGPVIERVGLLRIKGYVGRYVVPADHEAGAAQLRDRFGDQFPNLDDSEWRGWAETVWTHEGDTLTLSYDPALARTLDGIDADSPIPDLWPAFDALGALPILVVRGGLSDLLSEATLSEMARRHPGLAVITVPDEGHTPLLHRPAVARSITDLVARAPRPR